MKLSIVTFWSRLNLLNPWIPRTPFSARYRPQNNNEVTTVKTEFAGHRNVWLIIVENTSSRVNPVPPWIVVFILRFYNMNALRSRGCVIYNSACCQPSGGSLRSYRVSTSGRNSHEMWYNNTGTQTHPALFLSITSFFLQKFTHHNSDTRNFAICTIYKNSSEELLNKPVQEDVAAEVTKPSWRLPKDHLTFGHLAQAVEQNLAFPVLVMMIKDHHKKRDQTDSCLPL